jgi:S-adenosylmethionine:tRNA ribosyltransferase-isomerase
MKRERIIAVGTTVVRALEDARRSDGLLKSGEGLATRRIGKTTQLQVVDAILSGTHEKGTSHYELLLAFLDANALAKVDRELNAHSYRTHEFGDSVFIEKQRNRCPSVISPHRFG